MSPVASSNFMIMIVMIVLIIANDGVAVAWQWHDQNFAKIDLSQKFPGARSLSYQA